MNNPYSTSADLSTAILILSFILMWMIGTWMLLSRLLKPREKKKPAVTVFQEITTDTDMIRHGLAPGVIVDKVSSNKPIVITSKEPPKSDPLYVKGVKVTGSLQYTQPVIDNYPYGQVNPAREHNRQIDYTNMDLFTSDPNDVRDIYTPSVPAPHTPTTPTYDSPSPSHTPYTPNSHVTDWGHSSHTSHSDSSSSYSDSPGSSSSSDSGGGGGFD